VKFEVMNNLVGSSIDALPPWIAQWARVDGSLISVADVNGDHVLQWGEIRLGADLIMLATPELGGLPYVISGLVAAGGLAAALSTADGLLLTISNALVRDIFCHDFKTDLPPQQRVILSKFALMGVALIAALVATAKPAEILPMVSASFSLAASAFVPAMLLGILWRGTTRRGAVAGMLAGLGVTVFYMLVNAPGVRAVLGLAPGQQLWFAIQPLSAGVFGVPAGLLLTWLVSVAAPRDHPKRVFT
jgi:cation/acetate symporter